MIQLQIPQTAAEQLAAGETVRLEAETESAMLPNKYELVPEAQP